MRKMSLRSALLGTAAIAVGTVGAVEMAQAQLDEIVVTATKRERSLQDIPVSISAFSAEALELSGVTNLDSLQTTIPGLTVQTTQSSGSNTSVRIRNVGTTGNNLGFEGAVGIFVDGVYRSRAGASLGDLPDVERIEVLRGPQGTLFGKNTTAGAISIITKKPVLDEFDAELRATFGNFDHQGVRGLVNLPLVDGKLAARVSADYNRRDGFGRDINDPSNTINDRDRYHLRGQLLWAPTPDVEVRVLANYFAANEACCGATVFSDGPLLPTLEALTPGRTIANDDSQRDELFSTRDFPVSERVEDRNGQIEVSWDLPNGVNFFNLVSYQRVDIGSVNDVDFTGLDLLNAPFAAQQFELFTEEFRFSGQLNDLPLVQSANWLFGGYYSSENLGASTLVETGSDGPLVGGLINIGLAAMGVPFTAALTPGDAQSSLSGQNGKTRALFGHLDIDLLDWLNVSGGARYTSEDKTGGAVFTNNTAVAPLSGNLFIPSGPLSFTDAESDADRWIGTAALTVNFTNDISAYASFAHGYKSGGIDFNQLGGQAGFAAGTFGSTLSGGVVGPLDPTFEEETNNTYEVGVKTSFWDNRATLNVTGFHSVFSNFQIVTFTGTSFIILSAPEATTTGFESEFTINPIDGLNLGLSYTYADAEYSAPFVTPSGEVLGDSRLTNAPLHSAAVRATYRRPIPNTGLIGLLHGEWAYNSQVNTSTELDPTRVQNGFSLFNARAGVNTDDDRYGVQLWCRNCGNEQYRSIIFGLPGLQANGAFITPPREWGVTLSARY